MIVIVVGIDWRDITHYANLRRLNLYKMMLKSACGSNHVMWDSFK